MRAKTIASAAAAILFSLAAPAAGAGASSDLWLHIRVEEGPEARVVVNLPLEVARKAVPLIPDRHLRHGRIVVDCEDLSVAELRELWRELQAHPDATYVVAHDGDAEIRIRKSEGYLLVDVEERGDHTERVTAKIPVRVVDALLSGEGEELDLQAGVQALIEHGEGELVTVTGDGEEVRVWIDRLAEGP